MIKNEKISTVAGSFIIGFITAAAIIFSWATIKNVQFYQDIKEMKDLERCLVQQQMPDIQIPVEELAE